MHTCVNNEPSPFPRAYRNLELRPHYSAPRSSLKSDIVSLRLHLLSSAPLFIVGGEGGGYADREFVIDIRGRRQVVHQISGAAAEQEAVRVNKSARHPSKHG